MMSRIDAEACLVLHEDLARQNVQTYRMGQLNSDGSGFAEMCRCIAAITSDILDGKRWVGRQRTADLEIPPEALRAWADRAEEQQRLYRLGRRK